MPTPCRILPALCALALAHAAPPAPHNNLTTAERAAGWKLLFDGHSMEGWHDPARKSPPGDAWSIEDGCLKANPHPRITEDLVTAATFTDFELQFDWRISPGGNSGVKYRIQDFVFLANAPVKRFEDLVDYSISNRILARPARGQEYVIGFEYQVIDNGVNRDALRGGKYQSAALYDMAAPTRDATRPVGQFNHGRIVLKGNHVEHWLNGDKVLEVDLTEAGKDAATRWGSGSAVYHMLATQPRKDCPISLQNHDSAAWFRDIKIRPLP